MKGYDEPQKTYFLNQYLPVTLAPTSLMNLVSQTLSNKDLINANYEREKERVRKESRANAIPEENMATPQSSVPVTVAAATPVASGFDGLTANLVGSSSGRGSIAGTECSAAPRLSGASLGSAKYNRSNNSEFCSSKINQFVNLNK